MTEAADMSIEIFVGEIPNFFKFVGNIPHTSSDKGGIQGQ